MHEMKQLYHHDGECKDKLTGSGEVLERKFYSVLYPIFKQYVIEYGCSCAEVQTILNETFFDIKFTHLAGFDNKDENSDYDKPSITPPLDWDMHEKKINIVNCRLQPFSSIEQRDIYIDTVSNIPETEEDKQRLRQKLTEDRNIDDLVCGPLFPEQDSTNDN